MKIKKMKLFQIIILISIPLLAFASVLNVMSYRRMMAQTYVHASKLNTTGIVRKINYAISFGKPIEKFYGLDMLLESTKNLSDDILGIEVRDKENQQIAYVGESVHDIQKSSEDSEYEMKSDAIYAFVPFDEGTIIMKLDESKIYLQTVEYAKAIGVVDLILVGIIAAITGVLCGIYPKDGITIKRGKITSVLLLIGAQILFGAYTTTYTINNYQKSLADVSANVTHVIENDINEVIKKGVRFDEINGLEDYFDKATKDIQELSKIELLEGKSKKVENTECWDNAVAIHKEEQREFSIRCSANQKMIETKIRNNCIDVIILIMVTIFISLEVIEFVTSHIENKKNRKKGELYFPGFRLFVFVSGIAFSLDCGFISIFSTQLYEKMEVAENMSFLSGLPNTMYSAAIVIGLLGCSSLISRFGLRNTMTLGITMGIVGYVFCAVSVNLPMLIVARFIFGFCDGLVLNTIRLYASSQKDSAMHTKILVTYFAAINLGVCCSVVIGGLVADVTSYTIVFIVGIVLGLFSLFLVYLAGIPNEKKQEKTSFLDAVKQMKIFKVAVFMIFIIIPIYIATLYVGYTFPLFGDEIGFSNSLISGCLMVNYLLVAYLTDPISSFVMKRVSPKKATICYVFLQALSIGVFAFFPSVWTAFLALVLTSVWDGFGMVVIDSVLDGVKGTTTERSTLLQMLCGKVGMVVGPMIVTAGLGAGAAAATISIVVILGAGLLVYVLTGITEKKI